MNCAYHIQNVAVVGCNSCGKPLCPACDHRIKGFPYCQDCIVSGVELLRNHNQSPYSSVVKRQTSPFIAIILSFVCPGLGAAYNGQSAKALVYFAVFVGLFQMAVLTGGLPIFVLGFIGMWLFAALDSFRTARLIRSGVTPNGAEDIIVQRFSGNPKLWGIILTILGASFFLQAFFNIRFFIRAVLPVLLIGLGVYILRDYIFKAKKDERIQPNYGNPASVPTYAASFDNTNFRTGESDMSDDFATEVRRRTWKNS
jgi:hypothetical protein